MPDLRLLSNASVVSQKESQFLSSSRISTWGAAWVAQIAPTNWMPQRWSKSYNTNYPEESQSLSCSWQALNFSPSSLPSPDSMYYTSLSWQCVKCVRWLQMSFGLLTQSGKFAFAQCSLCLVKKRKIVKSCSKERKKNRRVWDSKLHSDF